MEFTGHVKLSLIPSNPCFEWGSVQHEHWDYKGMPWYYALSPNNLLPILSFMLIKQLYIAWLYSIMLHCLPVLVHFFSIISFKFVLHHTKFLPVPAIILSWDVSSQIFVLHIPSMHPSYPQRVLFVCNFPCQFCYTCLIP